MPLKLLSNFHAEEESGGKGKLVYTRTVSSPSESSEFTITKTTIPLTILNMLYIYVAVPGRNSTLFCCVF